MHIAGAATPSFVYFIQQGQAGPIKIGRANDVESRLSALQTGSAWPLRVLRAIETDRAVALERLLHRLFLADRLNGEWYAPSEAIEEFIESGRDWPEPATARLLAAWGSPPANVVSLAAHRQYRI